MAEKVFMSGLAAVWLLRGTLQPGHPGQPCALGLLCPDGQCRFPTAALLNMIFVSVDVGSGHCYQAMDVVLSFLFLFLLFFLYNVDARAVLVCVEGINARTVH